MADISLDNLALLPTPEVIQSLDFEAILARKKTEFTSRMPAYGLDYDVIDLETDPGVVLLQESAYTEVLLRARGNYIARQRYLYYAEGSAVDHLGAFYDCTRLVGESDDRYKLRIILSIMGRSTGGTAPRYRAVALGSSLRVADAVVYTEGFDPTVKIAVFAADNNGVADASLLSIVSAAVGADDVRMVNDVLSVRSAVVQVVNITASLTLFPSTPATLLDTLAASLPQTWIAESGLGRDLTIDWIKAKLMASGVQKVTVTAPAADVVVSPFQAARIGTVTLTVAGRDY